MYHPKGSYKTELEEREGTFKWHTTLATCGVLQHWACTGHCYNQANMSLSSFPQ